jgi:hypothetical protein
MNEEPKTRAKPQATADSQPDNALPLPHERDQSTGQVTPEPDPMVHQAKRDLDEGLVDTDLRATPGLDAERRKRLTPAPAGAGPASQPDPRGRAAD